MRQLPVRTQRLLGAAALTALTLAGARPAHALDPSRALSQYVAATFSAREGLPEPSITALLQTSDGYLWVGTQDGLYRFDGIRFTAIPSVTAPLHPAIAALLQAADGTVWAGTHGDGVLVVRDGALAPPPALPPELATAEAATLAQTPDGTVFVGTWGDGLYRLAAGAWIHVGKQDGLSNDVIRTLYVDGHGQLWVGTRAGLDQWNGKSLTTIPAKEVFAIAGTPDGELLYSTLQGIATLPAPTTSPASSTSQPAQINVGGRVLSLLIDREGTIWAGTADGALLRRRPGQTSFDRMDVAPNGVVAMLEDTEGDLWLGTVEGGLQRLADGKVVTISRAEGLPIDVATLVYEDHLGTIWIAGHAQGLVAQTPTGWRSFGTADGLPVDDARAMAEDQAGRLWVATDVALAWLDRDAGRFVAINGVQRPTTLARDRDGVLWTYSLDGGLERLAPDGAPTVVPLPAGPGGRTPVVQVAAADPRGGLWLGTNHGIAHVPDALAAGDPLATLDVPVISLLANGDGTLLLGTWGYGVGVYRGGHLRLITSADGLASDASFSLIDDGRGYVWASGNEGISRVGLQSLLDVADGSATTVSSIALGVTDGMRSAECSGGAAPSGIQARDGRLWFPTGAGVVVVDPLHLSVDSIPPPVHVEDVRVDGTPVLGGVVPPGRHGLEIDYTALVLKLPEEAQFRYQLEGFDPAPVDAGDRRSAYYAGLPPGRYRFHVLAANADGVWNTVGDAVDLVVRPAFYQTWWFRVVVVLGAAFLLGALYLVRVRRLLGRQRELSRLVDERTRTLAETLATLKSTQADLVRSERLAQITTLVQGVAHELNNPVGFIASNVEPLRRYIDFLLAAVHGLAQGPAPSAEARTALLRLSPQKDLAFVETDLRSLLQDLQEGARRAGLIVRDLQGLATSASRPLERLELRRAVERTVALLKPRVRDGVKVEIDVEGVPPLEARAGEIEQVVMNLVDNALRAVGDHGTVTVGARLEGSGDSSQVRLWVKDDGAGMTADVRQRATEPFFTTRAAGEGSGLGLAIVQSIAVAHDGVLTIDSAPGQGTRVEICFPRIAPEQEGDGKATGSDG
jgi:signal transduction histidine kinase/ligand-binding sensor domain-containing protein